MKKIFVFSLIASVAFLLSAGLGIRGYSGGEIIYATPLDRVLAAMIGAFGGIFAVGVKLKKRWAWWMFSLATWTLILVIVFQGIVLFLNAEEMQDGLFYLFTQVLFALLVGFLFKRYWICQKSFFEKGDKL